MFSIVSAHLEGQETWREISLIDKFIPFRWNDNFLNLFEINKFNIGFVSYSDKIHRNENLITNKIINLEFRNVITFSYPNKDDIKVKYSFSKNGIISDVVEQLPECIRTVLYKEGLMIQYNDLYEGEFHGFKKENEKYEINYTRKKDNSFFVYYNHEGVLDRVLIISDNVTRAKKMYYYKDGQIKSEKNFLNNIPRGTEINYSEDGKIKSKIVHSS